MIDMAQWTEVYHQVVKEREPQPTRALEVLAWPEGAIRGLVVDPSVFRFGQVGEVGGLLADVGRRFKVVVAGNYPRDEITGKLYEVGLGDLVGRGQVGVMGIEDVGTGFGPEFYGGVSGKLELSPRECLMIGGQLDVDGFPAVGAGMGAMIVSGMDGLRELLSNGLAEDHVLMKKFDIGQYLMGIYRPRDVIIIGIVGRNAAGKSATAERMVGVGQEMGIPTALLSIESFHIWSRKARSSRLAEVRDTDPEEYARRADQSNWFDMGKMREALETLRAKQGLHMEGVYDRAQGGEKVGTVDIQLDPEKGAVIIFEGKVVDELSDLMGDVIYITAHPNSRLERLFERDGNLRSMQELTDRLVFYTQWDLGHRSEQQGRVTRVLANNEDGLIELPSMVPLL